MEKEQEQLEALQDIRKMMKESSKFLSLSGLSGVFAGVYALIGAYFGHSLIDNFSETHSGSGYNFEIQYSIVVIPVLFICFSVLAASILTALYFSGKKAKKNHQKLFDHTSKKLLWNMTVPLSAGGILCLALLHHGNGMMLLVSPVMLIFYGLALIASGKFTVHEVRYLGYLQLCLGLINSFFLGSGLLYWALGFGVLHIIYGSIMWFKYDRKG